MNERKILTIILTALEILIIVFVAFHRITNKKKKWYFCFSVHKLAILAQ